MELHSRLGGVIDMSSERLRALVMPREARPCRSKRNKWVPLLQPCPSPLMHATCFAARQLESFFTFLDRPGRTPRDSSRLCPTVPVSIFAKSGSTRHPHRALRLLAICFIRSHSTEYSSRLPLSRWIPRAFPKAARKRLASRPWTSEWLVQGKQRIASAKPLSPANTTSDRLARHRMKTLWTRIDPDEQTTRPTGELGHHTSQVARSLPTGRRTVPQSVASLLHQRRLDWTLIARISAGNRRSKKQSCRPCRATKRPATLTPSRAGPSPRPMFLSHVGAGEKGHKMSKTRKSLFSIRFCPFALPGASFPGSAANLPA
ncbi:hypothetical protein BKA81DRAFT_221959 [Phyllosticta paracitricarpa]